MTDSYFTIKRRDRLRFFVIFLSASLRHRLQSRFTRIAVFGRIGSMGKK